MRVISLSYRRYALLLGILVSLLYVVFGVLAFQQYRQARAAIEADEQRAAGEEFAAVLHRVLEDLQQGAAELANWDEIYQQLANPVYFTYWYGHRIEGGREIAPRFDTLMVYDARGQALARFKDHPLPAAVEGGPTVRYLPNGKDIRVELIRPLEREGRRLGYLAVGGSVLENLRRLHAFVRIDPDSVGFALERATDDPTRLVAAAGYRLRHGGPLPAVDEAVLNMLLLIGLAVVLPTLGLIYFFTRIVGRNLGHVPALVSALRRAEGDKPQLPPAASLRIRELEQAEQSLLEYQHELALANRALDQKNRKLWDLAHRDVLTGAQNRRAFENFWQTLQSLSERERRSLRLMLCDVNHFKAINDTYGHDVGDGVLKAIVICLQKALRRGEQLFRLGGDEFVSILLDCDDGQATAVASRCAAEVARYPFRERFGIREPVRLSIGISPATTAPDTPLNDLLRQADVAMYHSKRPSSGTITLYRESLEHMAGSVLSSTINAAVYRAIETGEGLQLLYQPVRDLKSDRIAYYEALLRIRHEEGLLTPSQIMPVVESRQLERELDQAVMDALLKALYNGTIPSGTGVSLNLSAASISDEGAVSRLEAFQPFLPDLKIVIEVTETALITRMEEANSNLMRLRDQGFQIALDDFGSGYSSLRYLIRMPVDVVKFDISLIQGLGQEAHHRLVMHLVEFIAGTGQQTVAEGVEDEVTLQRVRDVGFSLVQGYLVGRPQELRPRGPQQLIVRPG